MSAEARAIVAPPAPGPLPVVGALLAPALARGQRLLSRALGGSAITVRRLRQAGLSTGLGAFRSRQVLWALGGSAVGTLVGLAAAAFPPPVRVASVALAGVVGLLLPDQLLQRAARARLRRLEAELPVMLEFLTLSLSAGEGVLDALRRVSRVGRGELAGEFAGAVASVGSGLPLPDTLVALSRDLDLPALTRCVDQAVGALERGTPLVEVFRAQAQDARDEAKRRLLESAGTREIAMLVPLVFLILPVTIAFAIFPGIMVLRLGF